MTWGTIPQLQMDGAQVSGHEESSMMRSARDRTMPKLQPADMQSDEVSRIQTQLEMLERQVSEFGGYRRQPRVSRDVFETEHGDRGRTLEGLQVGTSNVETDSPRPKEYGDDFRLDRVKLEHLTSIPRYEAGGGRNNRHMREAEYAGEPVRKSGGIKMKPATYDGSGSWLDYKAHFEVCADLNEWSQREQGMYLAASLRGQAQAVFGNLPRGSYDYDDLVKCLEERFAPPNQTELHRVQLRERRQRASETLSELGQDVRRLTNLAYPTAPSDLRETLAKEQFVDALVSSDMRLRIKQARPHDLNDAVRHAVELEAFDRAERKHMEGQGYMRTTSERSPGQDNTMDRDFKALQKSVAELQQSFTTWKLAQANPLTNVSYKPRNTGTWTGTKRKCFICGSEDHLRLNCPRNPQKQGKNTDDKKHQGNTWPPQGLGSMRNVE